MKYTNTPMKKTLDIQHSSKLNTFQEKNVRMDELQLDLENVIMQLEKAQVEKNTFSDTKVPDKILDLYLGLCDERKQIENSIKQHESSSDEIDYYINTSSILFQYYDLVEKGMSENNLNNMNNNTLKDKSILKYFVSPSQESTIGNKTVYSDDKATLLDKYMSFTESNFIKTIDNSENVDTCSNCGSSHRNIMVNDGYIFCNDCNSIEYVIIDHERPSYRDPPKFLWALKSFTL